MTRWYLLALELMRCSAVVGKFMNSGAIGCGRPFQGALMPAPNTNSALGSRWADTWWTERVLRTEYVLQPDGKTEW